MHTIIAGSRDITENDVIFMFDCLDEYHKKYPITEVVSGKANGSDTVGEIWARANNIPIKQFPADWANKGKSAGPIRNGQMGEYAARAIVFWDGKSRGSKHMIDTMEKLDKPICVWKIEGKAETDV